MYRNHKIGLVIPAHNEERLIGPTLDGVPPTVDRIYVVDDGSTDKQNEVVLQRKKAGCPVTLLKHDRPAGPGGAIITGYLQASQDGCEIVAVVGGDNQMDLKELPQMLDPIVDGSADYTKGNRFSISYLKETIERMPRLRFFANWLITVQTKIFSGCYDVVDVVDGYTAISKRAIDLVNWNKAWKRYGYPMDFLIRLNGYGLTVRDVPRTAIYLPGERQSQIKGLRYLLTVSPMLLKGFIWRLSFKYMYRDFHPLIMFYVCGLAFLTLGTLGAAWLVTDRLFFEGFQVTGSRSIAVAFFLSTGIQFFLFAMFFDREESKQAGIQKRTTQPAAVERPRRLEMAS